MKLLYTLLFTFFFAGLAMAQMPCEPDPMFADTLGVFPPPLDTTVENPSGGIDKVACMGKPYEFVFTIAIGDSLRIPNVPGAFAIDSIELDPNNAIMGLPSGLSYNCGVPNCTFYQGTNSCVSITGTPDASNALGEYQLVISGIFYSGALSLEQSVPGDLFPGFYALKLEAADSEACTTSSTRKITKAKVEMVIHPNPVSGYGKLKMDVPKSGTYQYRIFNMLGAEVFSAPMRLSAGPTEYELDFSFLSNGMYLYSLSNQEVQITKRLVVRK